LLRTGAPSACAQGHASAVSDATGGTLTASDTSVDNNRAVDGGGIYNYVSSITLDDSVSVNADRATTTDGGVFNSGGTDTIANGDV
jgi:hypothetical protein